MKTTTFFCISLHSVVNNYE